MKLYLVDKEYKIPAKLSEHEEIDVNTPNLGQTNPTLGYSVFVNPTSELLPGHSVIEVSAFVTSSL